MKLDSRELRILILEELQKKISNRMLISEEAIPDDAKQQIQILLSDPGVINGTDSTRIGALTSLVGVYTQPRFRGDNVMDRYLERMQEIGIEVPGSDNPIARVADLNSDLDILVSSFEQALRPVLDGEVVLQKGSSGTQVIALQSLVAYALSDAGLDPGILGTSGENNDGIDGNFGGKTEDAIEDLQAEYGIDEDGAVGRQTATAIMTLGQDTSAEPTRLPSRSSSSVDRVRLSMENATKLMALRDVFFDDTGPYESELSSFSWSYDGIEDILTVNVSSEAEAIITDILGYGAVTSLKMMVDKIVRDSLATCGEIKVDLEGEEIDAWGALKLDSHIGEDSTDIMWAWQDCQRATWNTLSQSISTTELIGLDIIPCDYVGSDCSEEDKAAWDDNHVVILEDPDDIATTAEYSDHISLLSPSGKVIVGAEVRSVFEQLNEWLIANNLDS